MKSNRRKFIRTVGTRPYRRLFIIAVEGAITEPQYFSLFTDHNSTIKVKCLSDVHKSSPPKVLDRMRRSLKEENLKPKDEAWVVVDKDQWQDEQLMKLFTWSQEKKNYGMALSNPKFEYWLLLHFEDGAGIESSAECDTRLQKYISDYDKRIEKRKFSLEMIEKAIVRARNRDYPPCTDWPRSPGKTTVYRLVENILRRRDG